MGPTDAAIGVPATRRSIARRIAIVSALTVVSAVLVVVGAVQLGAAVAADSLQRDGLRTTGTIVALESHRVGPRGQHVDGTVTVRYDAAGATHEAVVDVGSDIADQHDGATVAVVVDPDDPGRAALIDRTPQVSGMPAVVAFGLAALVGAMAIVAGRTVARLRRALRHEPWLFVRAQLRQTPLHEGSRRGSRTFVLLQTPAGEVSVEPIGLNRVDPSFAPEAWVAGLDRPTMALAPPGGGHVVAVHRRLVPSTEDTGTAGASRRRPPRTDP